MARRKRRRRRGLLFHKKRSRRSNSLFRTKKRSRRKHRRSVRYANEGSIGLFGIMGGILVFLLIAGAVSSLTTVTSSVMEAEVDTAFAKVPTSGFLLALAVAVIAGCAMKAVYSAKQKKRAQEREAAIGMDEIDQMNGHVFEKYIGTLLSDLGFENVTVTKGSGDQGVDVVASLGPVRYGIQCKRQSADVGNKAVQEVFSGLNMYGCSQGAVITNVYHTKSAVRLAEANSVLLWDRNDLKEMISDRLDGIRYCLDATGSIEKVKSAPSRSKHE